MKNKILKITTAIITLCVGIMLSPVYVSAAGSGETITPGSVYDNPVSHKKEYCPTSAEMISSVGGGYVNVTDLNITFTGEYDVVILPGVTLYSGNPYKYTYGINVFRKISDAGKGVALQAGAEINALEDNLNINYIRFDKGSKLKDYSHVFQGWSELTAVEGFTYAIEPGSNGSIDLGNTFNGCSKLTSIVLDFEGNKASFYNTFTGCDKLRDITIKNVEVSRIEQLAVRGDGAYSSMTGVNVYPMNIVFENIIFPENDTGSYLSNAFTTVSGEITFKNCKAGESDLLNFDRAFSGSKAIKIKPELIANYVNKCEEASGSYSGGNIEIKGASAYSANYMFNDSAYGVVTLNDFIKEGTTSASNMFSNSSVVNIKGIDTWEIGELNLNGLFDGTTVLYDAESDEEQDYNIEDSIKPQLEEVDFSKAVSADRMMCFANDGYIVDYSGLDLSGVDTFIPVSKNVPFITPGAAPSYYKLPYNNVYYQTERDKELCGGYNLTMITGTSGSITGESLATNSLMVGQRAEIRIINILSGDASTYNVIGGHELREYLNSDLSYFSDNTCTTPAVLTGVVSDGNNITVYTQDDGVEKDLDTGVSVDLGGTTGNLNVKINGSSNSIRMIDYNPKITIKKVQSPGSYIITDDAMKANAQFYTVDLAVIIDGTEKQVKEISRNINITLPLPENYDGKGVTILHYDKGLDRQPTKISAVIDSDAKTISFYMNSFSHIALFYNDADKETREIKVKWVDDGNYRNRSGITFNWEAIYKGGVIDSGIINYTADVESETTLLFDVYKEILGSELEGVNITYTIRSSIKHRDKWDNDTSTLTLTLGDINEEVEDRVVKIDFTDVSDADYRSYVSSDKNVTLVAKVNYDNGTFQQKTVTKVLASNYKIYEMPYELVTKQSDGSSYTDIVYTINAPDSYNVNIDYDEDKIVVTKDKDVFGDYNDNYTVAGFFKDDNNSSKIRPDEVKIKVRATFGDKEWTGNFSIICREVGYQYYQISISVPGTCNGIPRDSLTFEPDPVSGYKISISKLESDHAWIDYELDDSGNTDITYKKTLTITYIGDTQRNRPSTAIIYLKDSNGDNQITRNITIPTNKAFSEIEVDVPTNGDYVVTKVEGIDANYTLSYTGLNIVAIYNSSTAIPDKKYTQSFTIDINDNDNEDGSRPEKVTVTVSDGKGAEQKFDINVSKGKRFTKQLEVADESSWSITKIEGFPDRFKIALSSNTATIDYTPEKFTKKVSVVFEGDGDNKDETRPVSMVIHINNGSTLISNVTIDANTNWSANVELNKYREGVEAKYTIDCDDVKNYSKNVSDDTITLKFTGTLTEEAQSIENAKSASGNGVVSDGTEVKENDYSIESFDWIDYANRYPDLKRAYGYNKQKLYAHYIRYGIAEGRYATFTGKYSTVNEDILAAYFPDDYKYALTEVSTDSTSTDDSMKFDSTVSGNSTGVVDPTDDGTVVNKDGTTTEKIVSEDGTVTEITKDADGNVISTTQYKTGDFRSIPAWMYITLGILLLLAGAYIGVITLRNKAS